MKVQSVKVEDTISELGWHCRSAEAAVGAPASFVFLVLAAVSLCLAADEGGVLR